MSFLANANATGVAWSPDGTFLLFDTGQRTEVPQLARVDLILRTPKFREDQFRDLFNEDNSENVQRAVSGGRRLRSKDRGRPTPKKAA